MGNLTGTFPHRLCLLETSQVVHLQQHQSVVGPYDALLVAVLHQSGEAHLGDVLCIEVKQAVHRVILLAHLHQRIDVAQLLTQRFVGLLLDHLYCLRQVYLSECYVVAVVLDDGYFGHS